jgi:hypothetical protein
VGVAMLAGFGLVRSRAQQEELSSLKVAPQFSKLLFENAFVEVTEEKVPAGQGLPKHAHRRGVTISMNEYEADQKIYPDGRAAHSSRKTGDVNWAEPVVHETRNVGKTLQHVIRIELK